jgi:tRNA (guanine37-N1)-methyltransferase
MRVCVVTLFPELVRTVLAHGVLARAARGGVIALDTVDPRAFATDVHRTVDDRPYGGGPGMVMRVEPLRTAIRAARGRASPADDGAGAHVVYLGPGGPRLTHARAQALAQRDALVLVSGRYEGVDERLLETEVDEELSIGDYVLSGGELAAMVVVDAIGRLLPGVLGNAQSATQDSFVEGLLDCPHYTRPEVVDGRPVPAVLLSGDHAAIERWRRCQALGRTASRRPDLLAGIALSEEDQVLLQEYRAEKQAGVAPLPGEGRGGGNSKT